MSEQWYVCRDQEQEGPISSAQLRNLASSGSLQAEDLVWKEGLSEWVPARKVKDLFVKPPASPKRSTPPPQPLPTLAYDDDVTSSGDNDDRAPQKPSVWLYIGGILLILAGIGACESRTIIAAPFLIAAGSLLLPNAWNVIIAKWPRLRLHSTLIRTSVCVLALIVLGAIPPSQRIRPRSNRLAAC